MAVPARREPETATSGIDRIKPEWRALCLRSAKLYGLGYSRGEIAKAVADEMFADREWMRSEKISHARTRLRSWEEKVWFRDLVWDRAVIELDMSSGQILRGIKNKAKRGRVDAAKLALAITGRHDEKEQAVPAAVTINLVGVPRPARTDPRENEAVGLAEVTDED